MASEGYIDPIGDMITSLGWIWPWGIVGGLVMLWIITKLMSRRNEDEEAPQRQQKSEQREMVKPEEDENMPEENEVSEIWECPECEEQHDDKQSAKECCNSKKVTCYFSCGREECEDLHRSRLGAQRCGVQDDTTDWPTMIDDKIEIGHMRCREKDCGWEGDLHDTNTRVVGAFRSRMLADNMVFTGKYDPDEIQTEEIVIRTCPECGGMKLEFVRASAGDTV